MKQLRAARQPMTLCTPFRSRIGPIRVMAETFFRVGLDAPLGDNETQEHASRHPEHTLLRIKLYPFGSKAIERDPEISHQVVRLPGFYNDVIDICLYVSPEMVPKNMEHTPLICSSGVSEAKGHRNAAVHAERCDKRSRELVALFHFDLVVTGVSIKKG